MHSKDETGFIGEKTAEEYLTAQGHTILDRRWRCSVGELDLVTRDAEHLVAVEVKTRRGLGYGHPFEAVTSRKLTRLYALLLRYCRDSGHCPGKSRVDLVSVLLPPLASTRAPKYASARSADHAQVEHMKDVRP